MQRLSCDFRIGFTPLLDPTSRCPACLPLPAAGVATLVLWAASQVGWTVTTCSRGRTAARTAETPRQAPPRAAQRPIWALKQPNHSRWSPAVTVLPAGLAGLRLLPCSAAPSPRCPACRSCSRPSSSRRRASPPPRSCWAARGSPRTTGPSPASAQVGREWCAHQTCLGELERPRPPACMRGCLHGRPTSTELPAHTLSHRCTPPSQTRAIAWLPARGGTASSVCGTSAAAACGLRCGWGFPCCGCATTRARGCWPPPARTTSSACTTWRWGQLVPLVPQRRCQRRGCAAVLRCMPPLAPLLHPLVHLHCR